MSEENVNVIEISDDDEITEPSKTMPQNQNRDVNNLDQSLASSDVLNECPTDFVLTSKQKKEKYLDNFDEPRRKISKSSDNFQDNFSRLHSTFLNACTNFMQQNDRPTRLSTNLERQKAAASHKPSSELGSLRAFPTDSCNTPYISSNPKSNPATSNRATITPSSEVSVSGTPSANLDGSTGPQASLSPSSVSKTYGDDLDWISSFTQQEVGVDAPLNIDSILNDFIDFISTEKPSDILDFDFNSTLLEGERANST